MVSTGESNEHLNKIFRRNEIQQKAKQLFEAGFYNEAIQKYEEALHPSFLNNDHEESHPRGAIRDIYRYQGKFELALEEHQWFLKRNSSKEEYVEGKLELEALLEARNAHSTEPILRYVNFLRENHKKELPPNSYNSRATWYTSKIIRLYDYIGEANGGIAFVDQILTYFSRRNNVKKTIAEYLKIHEAFEQDKKEGFKGCLEAQPGTVCMGRATQALIQSDYFPW
ncbi:MAG TPA: hypothetical protein VD913_00160, partial [bacterium]|nr:hypothetical protein [bacterium]